MNGPGCPHCGQLRYECAVAMRLDRDVLAKELVKAGGDMEQLRTALAAAQGEVERLTVNLNDRRRLCKHWEARDADARAQLDAALAELRMEKELGKRAKASEVMSERKRDIAEQRLAAALAKNERLRACPGTCGKECIACLRAGIELRNDQLALLRPANDKAQAQLHAAVAALRKYGQHFYEYDYGPYGGETSKSCPAYNRNRLGGSASMPCTCGLDAALEAVGGGE